MPEKKLNIYQKLIEVRKSCAGLQKKNEGFQYKYVSSSDTLKALRGAMDEQGLLLIPEVLSHEIREYETVKEVHGKADKKGISYFTDLTIQYTWVNSEDPTGDKIVCQWCAQGVDTGEKGVGKALTYGEKYFLLKFFNIHTDKDDPDNDQTKDPPNTTTKRKSQPPKTQSYTPKEETGELCSETDMGKMFSRLRQTYNVTDTGVIHELLTKILKPDKEITSTKNVTAFQMNTVLNTLNNKEAKVRATLDALSKEDRTKQANEESGDKQGELSLENQ